MIASPQSKRASPPHVKQSGRALTFSILLDVERKGAYASDLLFSRLGHDVEEREASLATELVMGTLRWQRTLDFLIQRHIKRHLSALDTEVLIALRVGIYQLRHLSRIPTRAAVNESVELVRRAKKSSAVPLMNAVLRRAAEEKNTPLTSLLSAMDPAEAMAIANSHPTWMVQRWLRTFGEQRTLDLLSWNNQAPSQACAILNLSRRNEIIRSLEHEGVQTSSGRLLRDALIIHKGNIGKTGAFDRGWISIQDEASQMIPLLLDVEPGHSVLDLCAAPGGKTFMLARNADKSGFVVACDIHASRLRIMRERFNRAGVKNIALIALNGARVLPFAGTFDRILVDAPCSGTGTLQRNPEIRWRLHEKDLLELHAKQVALLSSALNCLAPKGKLIYSTCSLETEENDTVVRDALTKNSSFTVGSVAMSQNALAAGLHSEDLTDADGAFRTFPPEHHTDGFFAALICRK